MQMELQQMEQARSACMSIESGGDPIPGGTAADSAPQAMLCMV